MGLIDIAFNPGNGLCMSQMLWYAAPVINPATNTVVETMPVGMQPRDIAFNPDNGFLRVTNPYCNTALYDSTSHNDIFGRMQWHIRQRRPSSHMRNNQHLWKIINIHTMWVSILCRLL
jgi:hypothetical protein